MIPVFSTQKILLKLREAQKTRLENRPSPPRPIPFGLSMSTNLTDQNQLNELTINAVIFADFWNWLFFESGVPQERTLRWTKKNIKMLDKSLTPMFNYILWTKGNLFLGRYYTELEPLFLGLLNNKQNYVRYFAEVVIHEIKFYKDFSGTTRPFYFWLIKQTVILYNPVLKDINGESQRGGRDFYFNAHDFIKDFDDFDQELQVSAVVTFLKDINKGRTVRDILVDILQKKVFTNQNNVSAFCDQLQDFADTDDLVLPLTYSIMLAMVSIIEVNRRRSRKMQQVWFINKFGANVNLGNIAPNEVIPLEALRLGLRGDTFENYL